LLPTQEVQRVSGVEEASECAQLMVGSEPWITLQLSLERAVSVLTDPAREVHAVRDARGIAAFIVLDMRGLVAGYIQTVCVRPDCRGQGLGSSLISWAEERIFRDSPNAFICVSSFNVAARRLYERLGYEPVGVLRGFVVADHDELLLRKTRGPWADFLKNR
jgi:ribosomal-protein-alanine N-acetyltransferase